MMTNRNRTGTHLAFAVGVLVASYSVGATAADVIERRTETTTYSGTVSEIDPGTSTIVVRSEQSTAPTQYVFTKETVFADPQGHVVSYDAAKDAPVTIHYVREGDRLIVTRVDIAKPSSVIRKETTTTETETR